MPSFCWLSSDSIEVKRLALAGTAELAVGEAEHLQAKRLARADPGDVGLGDADLDPQGVQRGDLGEDLAFLEAAAFQGLEGGREHEAAGRGDQLGAGLLALGGGQAGQGALPVEVGEPAGVGVGGFAGARAPGLGALGLGAQAGDAGGKAERLEGCEALAGDDELAGVGLDIVHDAGRAGADRDLICRQDLAVAADRGRPGDERHHDK